MNEIINILAQVVLGIYFLVLTILALIIVIKGFFFLMGKKKDKKKNQDKLLWCGKIMMSMLFVFAFILFTKGVFYEGLLNFLPDTPTGRITKVGLWLGGAYVFLKLANLIK